MPVPLLTVLGYIAGAVGVGSAIHGAAKMKEANDTLGSAQSRHKRNITHFEEENHLTTKKMDELGTLELNILRSFSEFSDIIEQIQNRPVFKPYSKSGVALPEYNSTKLKEVSIGAGVLLGGLGGAALGTAGGFAAGGATTAAVFAFGTASTGTAISSLSGAALTNSLYAALGGGAIKAGGLGMVAGKAALATATVGVGLLVGGIIFSVTGENLSEKADEAWSQMKSAEEKINKICNYLLNLRQTANKYKDSLTAANNLYIDHLKQMETFVIKQGHTDWDYFTDEEKLIIENTVLLVSLLYNMCKVELVLQSKNGNDMNAINTYAVEKSIRDAKAVVESVNTAIPAYQPVRFEIGNVFEYGSNELIVYGTLVSGSIEIGDYVFIHSKTGYFYTAKVVDFMSGDQPITKISKGKSIGMIIQGSCIYKVSPNDIITDSQNI